MCSCFHVWRGVYVQSSAWEASEPTSDVAAQQVSALDSLVTASPDELSSGAREAAVSQVSRLMAVIDPRDTRSLSKALAVMASVARQASSDAVLSAGSPGPGGRRLHLSEAQLAARHARRLADEATAQSLQDSTNDAILVMAGSMLNGTTPGESEQTVSVSVAPLSGCRTHARA